VGYTEDGGETEEAHPELQKVDEVVDSLAFVASSWVKAETSRVEDGEHREIQGYQSIPSSSWGDRRSWKGHRIEKTSVVLDHYFGFP